MANKKNKEQSKNRNVKRVRRHRSMEPMVGGRLVKFKPGFIQQKEESNAKE